MSSLLLTSTWVVQVVITFVLVITECAIVAASFAVYGGADSVLLHPARNRTRLTCKESTPTIVVPFGFVAVLIVMCTVYAVKTRNLPENFNEAKFIGFTMYTTCVIWVAFVLIYFNSDQAKVSLVIPIYGRVILCKFGLPPPLANIRLRFISNAEFSI